MRRFLGTIATLYVTSLTFFALWVYNLARSSADLHFLWLAQSFLAGRLDLPRTVLDRNGLMDLTVHAGKLYWPLGPMPAIAVAPFVAAFGASVRLAGLLHVAAATAVAWLAYSIARRAGHVRRDALWLSCAFCAGSVAVGVLGVGGPWYFAQTLTLAFLLAAVRERYGADRPFVEGIWFAFAVATRISAGAAAIYFLAMIATGRGNVREKARRAALFCAPAVLAVALLGWYDFARFGNPLDSGYASQYLDSRDVWAGLRAERGVFSLRSVADNARWYFLAMPKMVDGGLQVDRRGMSFFLVSPFFLLAFFAKRRDAAWWSSLAVFAVVLLFWLGYYSPGAWQFGPRYLNDAMPFLYVMLLGALAAGGRVRGRHKALIGASILVNVLLLAAYTSSY